MARERGEERGRARHQRPIGPAGPMTRWRVIARRMSRRSRVCMLLLPFAAACTRLAPVETEMEREFEPPQIYRAWYAEVERCSGLSGAFDRITWFEAEVYDKEGVERSGVWSPPHTIFLDPEVVAATCDTVPGGGPCFRQQNVKHEMLHELRQGGHDKGYPDSSSVFIRCANL